MNLLETMNVGAESGETMKRSESEEQQKMQNLQDTISKCKTLLKEQAQVIEQKESRISQLEKSLREKDAAYARLLQQKEEQKARLERKIESERSSYRYLNSRLRETEEELADVKEQLPWWKKKRKKKSKLYYYKKHWWKSDKFKENVVMGIMLAGYICVVCWLFKWSLG